MDIKGIGEALAKVAKGELSAKKFSEMAVAYLDSPDWQRRKAAQAAEDLKAWRSGRARLFELIEKARADGYVIETETMPLRHGHDSVLVQIEGGRTGFPSFFDTETVEEAFAEILADAGPRRAQRAAER